MGTIQEWQRSHNLRRGAGKKARELCRDGKVPGATQPGGVRTSWHLTDDSFAYLNQKYDEGYFNEFKTNEKLGSDFRPIGGQSASSSNPVFRGRATVATTKEKGDKGELFVQRFLTERGYSCQLLKRNFPTYDIEVFGKQPFFISVKTSIKKQHVRLGRLTSVNKLSEGNFVFALMPNQEEISFVDGGYRLLIIPAEVAKRDAIYVHETYPGKKGYSVIVKGYSDRGAQRAAWARWKQFEDAWHLLPNNID